jgi:type IV secretion system protein VirB9
MEPVVIQQACEVTPPQIIEVPVPVPMPCQLKAEPEFDAVPKTARRGQKSSIQLIASKPDGPGGINSVQQFPYMEGALYQVYVAVNNATTILLQPGEYFHQAVIGDKGKWTTSEMTVGNVAGDRSGLVVNCNEAGAQSNLTIGGSKRVYLLELHCTEKTYHAQVSWSYPAESGIGVMRGSRTAPVIESPKDLPAPAAAPSTARYEVESNRAIIWLPTHVYDTGEQGKQTFIVFPAALGATEAPVLYLRSFEGTQSIVNYRVKQGYWINDRIHNAETLDGKRVGLGEPVTYYVLDQIADVLELRIGEKKPTIVRITRHQQGV